MMKFKLTFLASIIISCCLAGCGGHSSVEQAPTPEPEPEPTSAPEPTPVPEPEPIIESETQINLKVLDAYIEEADVFADLNENFKFDEGEPTGKTDQDGKISIKFKNRDLEGKSYIRFMSLAKKGSKTKTLDKPGSLDNDVLMSRIVFLNDNIDKEHLITPFSTLTDIILLKNSKENTGAIDQNSFNRVISDISQEIGVNPDKVDTDYNDADNKDSDSLDSLVASELLANNGLLPNNLESFADVIDNPVVTEDSIKQNVSEYESSVKTVVKQVDEKNDVKSVLDKSKKELAKSYNHLSTGATDEWGCGTTDDGNVSCWGVTSWGVLGDPVAKTEQMKDDFTDTPVRVVTKIGDEYVPINNIAKVSGGNIHACAVSKNGEVYCWGGNYHGQLGVIPNDQKITSGVGDERTDISLYARKVLAGEQEAETNYKYLTNIADVSSAHNHTCALTRDGEVYCWGENSSYQLGGRYEKYEKKYSWPCISKIGTDLAENFYRVVQVPVKVKFPDTVKKVLSISAGLDNHCAIVENVNANDKRNLYCWGADNSGIISGNLGRYVDEVNKKYGGIFADNEPWNWKMVERDTGDATYIFGTPVMQVLNRNEDSAPIENVTNVAVTGYDSHLILSFKGDSNLYSTWNDDFWPIYDTDEFTGEINNLNTNSEENFVCFTMGDNRELYCGGSNRFGMLGRGVAPKNADFEYDFSKEFDEGGFARVSDQEGNYLKNVRDISIRKRSVCANVEDESANDLVKHKLYCWGSSTFGQLGYNDHDGGFSYVDTSSAWEGAYNKYFYKDTRYQTSAVNVTDLLYSETYDGAMYFVGDHADSGWTKFIPLDYDERTKYWTYEIELKADREYKFKLSKDESLNNAYGACDENESKLCLGGEKAVFTVESDGAYILKVAVNPFNQDKLDYTLAKTNFDALYFVGNFSDSNLWTNFLPFEYNALKKVWTRELNVSEDDVRGNRNFKITQKSDWTGPTPWGKCPNAETDKLCVNVEVDGNGNAVLQVTEAGIYIITLEGSALSPESLSISIKNAGDYE